MHTCGDVVSWKLIAIIFCQCIIWAILGHISELQDEYIQHHTNGPNERTFWKENIAVTKIMEGLSFVVICLVFLHKVAWKCVPSQLEEVEIINIHLISAPR